MATETAQRENSKRSNTKALLLSIRSRVDDVPDAFRDEVREKLTHKLGKFSEQIKRVQVTLEDVNGPKGGDDMVVRVQVSASGLPNIVVAERAASLGEALIFVSRSVEKTVRRALEKAGHAAHSARRARKGARTKGRVAGNGHDKNAGYNFGGTPNVKANRAGMVSGFEISSAAKPTRKSTRGSANRAKAATPMHNEMLRQLHSPEATARRSLRVATAKRASADRVRRGNGR